ncbi:glycosyltransferase family 87 protein [Sciscionella marina]|uniref:glycosyltransferase family 87 protein n=1 Tax=Sciscionella marina TaxID=508770 RepID=UPI0012F6F9C1|nr:glycosyltransferase family 87 protein [Sciscionella marina]
MSSRDDESNTRQRTVAELLAQHGGSQQQGEAARGRRRRAEDAAEDTAPQAIIDRVRGDTGTNMSPVAHTANGHPAPPQPRPQTQPQPNPQPSPQPQPKPKPSPQPQAQQQQAAGAPVPARPQSSGRLPVKPPTRAMPPVDEPEQQAGFPEPPEYDDYSDPAKYTPPPPLPEDAPKPQRASMTARLAGAPPEPLTEQIQAIPEAPLQGRPSAVESTGYYTPDFDDEDEEPGEQTAFHPVPDLEDDADEDYAEPADYDQSTHYDEPARYDESQYLDEDGYEPAEDEDYDYEEEPRGAREWLTLVGLIAAGVVGGGLVWLGFDWLWSYSKIIGVIAAIVVTLAIVFLVRKAWRAKDLQTTIFSVVVGLIVTATPALLLYLGS